MTYQKAQELFKTARNGCRVLANNTRLEKRGEDFAVRLHSTDVVLIHPDGTYTYNSGGWKTVTTKDRINRFSPLRLYQENGIWKVADRPFRIYDPDKTNEYGTHWIEAHPDIYVFEDGMKSDANGVPIGEVKRFDPEIAKIKRKLDRDVKRFIDGYAAEVAKGDFPWPGTGDCWGCLFQPVNPENGFIRGTVMGTDHLEEHFKDKYFVPSLLGNAIQTAGYRDPAFIYHHAVTGSEDYVKEILRSYFMKLKPALLEARLARAES